nr:uncharacterized protein LOC119171485 [Rhipicephalus microplus]
MSSRADKCGKRFAKSHKWRHHLQGNDMQMQGRYLSGYDCFETVYGDSDGSNCLDSTLFSLLFLCWNDREPVLRLALIKAGAVTRRQVVQAAEKLRECFLGNDDTD